MHVEEQQALWPSLVQQQQEVLAHVLDEVQQQLWSAAASPLTVSSAFSTGVSACVEGSCVAVGAGAVGRLQQLSLLQLLQGQLMQASQQHQQQQQEEAAAQQGGPLQSTARLLQYLQGWSGGAGSHSRKGSRSRVVAPAEGGVCCAALRQDGALAASVFGDVASATALLQVGGSDGGAVLFHPSAEPVRIYIGFGMHGHTISGGHISSALSNRCCTTFASRQTCWQAC